MHSSTSTSGISSNFNYYYMHRLHPCSGIAGRSTCAHAMPVAPACRSHVSILFVYRFASILSSLQNSLTLDFTQTVCRRLTCLLPIRETQFLFSCPNTSQHHTPSPYTPTPAAAVARFAWFTWCYWLRPRMRRSSASYPSWSKPVSLLRRL